MTKQITFAAALTLALTLGAAAKDGESGDRRKEAEEQKILEFKTMVGVPRPYTGAANAIRGVAGGGLPWVITSAKGELKADGHLEVKVRGLVFDPNDPDVVARGLANRNTVPFFRAVVSCLSKDLSGAATTVNVMTGQFPATLGTAESGGGNVGIEAHIDLPKPCIAPIVFVTNPGGSWFSATGL